MSRFIRVLTLCVLCAATPALFAEPEGTDDQVTQTPTSLADLLPAGGVDAIAYDFWVVATMPDVKPYHMYMRWSALAEGNNLVFQRDYGSTVDGAGVATTRLTYDRAGTFLAFDQLGCDDAGEVVTHIHAEVDGTDLVFREQAGAGDEVRRVPLAVFASSLPDDLMPLVYAYQVRAGDGAYQTRYMNMFTGRTSEMTTLVGEPAVHELNGEDVTAYTIHVPPSGEDTPEGAFTTETLVLEDGSILSLILKGPDFEVHYDRATEQQIEEIFGLDLDDAPAEDANE